MPGSVTYSVSADATTWHQVAAISEPPTSSPAQVGTYAALNLSASARNVRVTVNAGPGWSMLDELQVCGT